MFVWLELPAPFELDFAVDHHRPHAPLVTVSVRLALDRTYSAPLHFTRIIQLESVCSLLALRISHYPLSSPLHTTYLPLISALIYI
jgi:hypothetical protein